MGEIASKLRVANILVGTVRRAGSRIRVTVRTDIILTIVSTSLACEQNVTRSDHAIAALIFDVIRQTRRVLLRQPGKLFICVGCVGVFFSLILPAFTYPFISASQITATPVPP